MPPARGPKNTASECWVQYESKLRNHRVKGAATVTANLRHRQLDIARASPGRSSELERVTVRPAAAAAALRRTQAQAQADPPATRSLRLARSGSDIRVSKSTPNYS